MAYAVSRDVVEAFYRTYISRDPAAIGALLDDDVEWHIIGPVKVMHICGYWRGKPAVIDRYTNLVPNIVQFKSLDIEALLVDGDRSAMFGKIATVHLATGRSICYRVAHLTRYRNDKVCSHRVVVDSLDAAEQYIGHPIAMTDNAPGICDDIVAI